MPIELVIAVISLAGGGGIGTLLTVRSRNRKTNAEADRTEAEVGEKQATSAEVLARAYTILVDDLRKDLERQDGELKTLRADLRSVVRTRDAEVAALRTELATERGENSRLRARVAQLEETVGGLLDRPKT